MTDTVKCGICDARVKPPDDLCPECAAMFVELTEALLAVQPELEAERRAAVKELEALGISQELWESA